VRITPAADFFQNMSLSKEVAENHQLYLKRKEFYKSFGYDIDRERKFILDKAQPIFGDILEVGTGKGHFALALAQEGYRFMSIDISEEEQKYAKLNLEYFGFKDLIDFKIENAEQMSFQDKSFDIIFSINTIHHLNNPYKVIDELARIVSFEGKIVLSDFTGEGLKLMDKIHESEGRKHQAGKVSLADIEKYLLSRGFTVEKDKDKFQQVLVARHILF
ncbi:class I SAM-dependent methyltransferase, partial [Candidatus Omnitrophota bacterium]